MDFLPEAISEYVEAHSAPESELLQRINRETHARVLMPRMLSGHLQGRVLSMFSHMIRPKRILEIGTYTGYSAICLAEGLTEDGLLYTLDINEELETRVRGYFLAAGLENKINYQIGNAVDIIPTLTETWDLVFIDADKLNYHTYYELVLPKVRQGGFIISDNVLWSGKVADPTAKKDKDLENMLAFNTMIQNDPRVENVLFPIRDGLSVARKR
ncbi:O-methyltransferase [Cytophagaceae bacterium DM2B3-1]|uniref:O-methyltransferase n=1 Tax=Xanthocytophaga flava TaxID=3048013 RepID=A0ABT7CQ99_9BACT|nr:O-methyltransferase [Xanthocytophaga flavus]MDJ1468038.1 O-methyltransferase [Xanthocytophaga flavus]MDJ1495933.1 O-methyltransferase [Xanthocytophaga flavus]